jgi:hypothetical protein
MQPSGNARDNHFADLHPSHGDLEMRLLGCCHTVSDLVSCLKQQYNQNRDCTCITSFIVQSRWWQPVPAHSV